MSKLGLFGLALLAGTVCAQQTSADVPERIGAERERLSAARAVIEQVHQERMRQCWQRFAVNDCLREARRVRHQALEPLRQQELQLNAEERAWRTEQRELRLQDKTPERQP